MNVDQEEPGCHAPVSFQLWLTGFSHPHTVLCKFQRFWMTKTTMFSDIRKTGFMSWPQSHCASDHPLGAFHTPVYLECGFRVQRLLSFKSGVPNFFHPVDQLGKVRHPRAHVHARSSACALSRLNECTCMRKWQHGTCVGACM